MKNEKDVVESKYSKGTEIQDRLDKVGFTKKSIFERAFEDRDTPDEIWDELEEALDHEGISKKGAKNYLYMTIEQFIKQGSEYGNALVAEFVEQAEQNSELVASMSWEAYQASLFVLKGEYGNMHDLVNKYVKSKIL